MYTLEEIHDISYDFLVELNTICRKHDIDIMLDSGTLLGAVREKDFIPWDDDVDLVIKRSDYDKFIKVICDELSDKYEFLPTSAYNGHFFDFAPRFIYKEGFLRNETEEDKAYNNMQNRVAFDLFILENCPDNELIHKLYVFMLKMLYGMGMAHRVSLKVEKHSFVDRMRIMVLTTMGKFFSLKSIFAMFDKLSNKCNKKDTARYWIPTTILKEIHLTYDKKWYEGTSEYPIRDTSFKCPKDSDAVLKNLYGPTYMTPPPVEERVSMHME
ncbi:MAG: LicD family protein [Clostridia bacterium]|nr:LicD family protein [Clostridia bacterium]